MSQDKALLGSNLSGDTAGKTEATPAGDFSFLPMPSDRPPALRAAIQHMRAASQALWDARTKQAGHVALANFLEPLQVELQALLTASEEVADFLDKRDGTPA